MAAVLFWFTNASVDSVYRTVPHEIGRNINNIVEQDIYIERCIHSRFGLTCSFLRHVCMSKHCLEWPNLKARSMTAIFKVQIIPTYRVQWKCLHFKVNCTLYKLYIYNRKRLPYSIYTQF